MEHCHNLTLLYFTKYFYSISSKEFYFLHLPNSPPRNKFSRLRYKTPSPWGSGRTNSTRNTKYGRADSSLDTPLRHRWLFRDTPHTRLKARKKYMTHMILLKEPLKSIPETSFLVSTWNLTFKFLFFFLIF